MPLRLNITSKLSNRSERVKWVELHPSEPWLLAALYSGHVMIWNYATETLVRSIEVVELPVRCAKFIVRKQWFICGSDDYKLRVYNYNTSEKLREWEAHQDYLRCIEVHPSQPVVLSSSDDLTIKLWNWEKRWDLMQTFEAHSHYVMQVKLNPKDTNTFASASLDKTIKVWGITGGAKGGTTLDPHFTLEGHEKGVNCIDYYPGADKPYLLSGADDFVVRIWDYQTKACVSKLEGHTNNISAVAFHPKLPVIISASEDTTVRVWHASTYRLEKTLNYRFERAWSVGISATSNKVALGFDEGSLVIKLGKESPVISMDKKTGKIMWTKNNEVYAASCRGTAKGSSDGDALVKAGEKDLGSSEIYPQTVAHNSNGRFVAFCGDGEYIVYTAGVLRNKCYGPAMDFVWSSRGTGDFAVRETQDYVKVFKSFKEKLSFTPRHVQPEGLCGGSLIAVTGHEAIAFYDWETGKFIQRIDVPLPKACYWNDEGDRVCIATKENFYVLKYNEEAVEQSFQSGAYDEEKGVAAAFELESEVTDIVRSAQWIGDCFLYVSKSSRLCYCVGGQIMTVAHLDDKMYLLGYLARESRVYLSNKQHSIFSYQLLTSILEYQTAVLRNDFEAANELLASGAIPKKEYNNISRFLESQGFKEEALQVADDPDQRFSLALQLQRLDIAHKIMADEVKPSEQDDADVLLKWKQLGDLALAQGELKLADDCGKRAHDLSGLLLLYTSLSDRESLEWLAQEAQSKGRTNVAFAAFFTLGDVDACVDLLIRAKRLPEASFFARSYRPSRMTEVLQLWKTELSAVSQRAASALADPGEHPEGFPDLAFAKEAEQWLAQTASARKNTPSTAYAAARATVGTDLIQMAKEGKLAGAPPAPSANDAAISAMIEEAQSRDADVKVDDGDAEVEADTEAEAEAEAETAQKESAVDVTAVEPSVESGAGDAATSSGAADDKQKEDDDDDLLGSDLDDDLDDLAGDVDFATGAEGEGDDDITLDGLDLDDDDWGE